MNRYPGISWFVTTIIAISAGYLIIKLFLPASLADADYYLLPLFATIGNSFLLYSNAKRINKSNRTIILALLTIALFILNYFVTYMLYVFIISVNPPLWFRLIFIVLILIVPGYDLIRKSTFMKRFEKKWKGEIEPPIERPQS